MPTISTKNTFNFSFIFDAFKEKWYLYLALFIVLILFVAVFIFTKPTNRNKLTHTQKVAYTAVFAGLCLAVNLLTVYPVSYIAISFLMTIGIVSAFMLGSKCAFLVCFLGDFLGVILFPSGPYNPIIGIASGLMGFIPGIIFERFKWNNVIKILVSGIICLVICTFVLNTFGLWFMYSSGFWFQPKKGTKTFFAYLLIRMPWQVLVALLNVAICILLIKKLEKLLPKAKFNVLEEK